MSGKTTFSSSGLSISIRARGVGVRSDFYLSNKKAPQSEAVIYFLRVRLSKLNPAIVLSRFRSILFVVQKYKLLFDIQYFNSFYSKY
jgi:hypothetical protein